jgi:hypothetical protein
VIVHVNVNITLTVHFRKCFPCSLDLTSQGGRKILSLFFGSCGFHLEPTPICLGLKGLVVVVVVVVVDQQEQKKIGN